MKAITIKQPWATLIALGEKKFETRGWATKHRGPLAIHAGKSVDKKAFEEAPIKETLAVHGITSWQQLPTGVVLATVDLVNCWRMVYHPGTNLDVAANIHIGAELDVPKHHPDFHKYIVPEENEIAFGDWTPGRYAWELANLQVLPEPVPAKGQLSLWNWSDDDANGAT